MFLYHIAVAKPKESHVWTIVSNRWGAIIGKNPVGVVKGGEAALPSCIGKDNKYQDPADWEVRAAKVVL